MKSLKNNERSLVPESIKSIFWSLLLLSIYMGVQSIINNMDLGMDMLQIHPDYSEPSTWVKSLLLKQVNIQVRALFPVLISMAIFIILYKFVLRQKISLSCGFVKTNVKSVLIGIFLAGSMILFYSLICNNYLWEELLHKKGIINLFEMMKDSGIATVMRNTILGNIIMMLPMVTFIPFFEEILFRGLIYNKLGQVFKYPFVICLQAILYGIVYVRIHSFFETFIIGLILGYIYMLAKSIWIPILLHMFFNISMPLIQESENLSKFLSSPKLFNSTEVIDTYVYNSLNGNHAMISNMPLVLNIIFGAVLLLIISTLLFLLWKSNKVVENDSAS